MRINLKINKLYELLEITSELDEFRTIVPKHIEINGSFDIEMIKKTFDSISPQKITYNKIYIYKPENVENASNLGKKVNLSI